MIFYVYINVVDIKEVFIFFTYKILKYVIIKFSYNNSIELNNDIHEHCVH